MLILIHCQILAGVIAINLSGETFGLIYRETSSGFVFGLIGTMLGWLAWWGAVEPLPALEDTPDESTDEGAAVVECGICLQNVLPDVRVECQCGRFFHSGCYQARKSVYTGDPSRCPVCN